MGMTESKFLLPSDWANAALVAIAADGIDKLSIERLAKTIGVTKGSFYWHFADRSALIISAAETWERLGTDDVITAMTVIEDPRQRLRALFEVSFGDDKSGPTDTAMASRADDALIGAIVRRVTAKRINFLGNIFTETGHTPPMAAQKARLAYAAYLGHFHMVQALGDDDHFLSGQRNDYLDRIVETLIREP